MTSAIDATKPAEGKAYTVDVRANFAAAKAEIEALQNFQSNYEINLFALLTDAQKVDFKAGSLTFDAGALLQSAIDTASALSSYSEGRSVVDVRVPAGRGKISSAQVIVKAHVNLICEGVLHNALADTTAAALWFKQNSHCERLLYDGNGQGGVIFGEAGVTMNFRGGQIDIYNVGTAGARVASFIKGDLLSFERMNVEGGAIGIDFGDGAATAASRVKIDSARSYNSGAGGVRVAAGSSHIAVGRLIIDSGHITGLYFGSCTNVHFPDVYIYYNDAVAGAVYTSGAIDGVTTGNIKGSYLRAEIVNTGSAVAAVRLGTMLNSVWALNIHRGVLPSGNANNINTAIGYAAGVDPGCFIFLNCAAAITKFTGTVLGQLVTWDGTTEVHNKPLQAPSLALTNATLRDLAYGRATADQSLTTQTALQNITGMSFPIAANEEWIAEVELDVGALLSTTGIKVGVTTPAGATQNLCSGLIPTTYVATNTGAKQTTASATALDYTAATQASQTNAKIKMSFWCLNGATPGTVQFQFAQSTSSATAITIRKGSSMRAERIA